MQRRAQSSHFFRESLLCQCFIFGENSKVRHKIKWLWLLGPEQREVRRPCCIFHSFSNQLNNKKVWTHFFHPHFVEFVSLPTQKSLAVSVEWSCEGDSAACKVMSVTCVCVCVLPSSYWQWTRSIVSPACLTCRRLPTSLTSTGTPCTRRRWRLDLFLMLVQRHQMTLSHTCTHTPCMQ